MIVRMAEPVLGELGAEKVYLLSRESSREKAEALCRDKGWDGVFCDLDALLAADIDTAYVALPNLLHYEYAQKALLAGKHVLVEKPMVPRRAEAGELGRLAREKGVCLMEAMTVHHLPAFREMKAALGRIGRPRLAVFSYCQRSSRYDGFLRGELHPAFDPQQAGGALMDINVYNLHAILGLFGKPESVRYEASLQRGIDTNGVLTLDYGGFRAVAVGAKDCGGPCGGTVQGEEGYLSFSGPVSGMTEFSFTGNDRQSRTFSSEPDPLYQKRMAYEFRVFRQMTETGNRAEMDRLLELSADAGEILEEARRQAGVRFPGDC